MDDNKEQSNAEYQREWRKKNPGKAAEYTRKWTKKIKEKKPRA
jgi:hypothetical protein